MLQDPIIAHFFITYVCLRSALSRLRMTETVVTLTFDKSLQSPSVDLSCTLANLQYTEGISCGLLVLCVQEAKVSLDTREVGSVTATPPLPSER